jgi:hypothetical protein
MKQVFRQIHCAYESLGCQILRSDDRQITYKVTPCCACVNGVISRTHIMDTHIVGAYRCVQNCTQRLFLHYYREISVVYSLPFERRDPLYLAVSVTNGLYTRIKSTLHLRQW